MPQLDVVTFFSQLFWLTAIFGVFYTLNVGKCLPVLGQLIKSRRKYLTSQRGGVSLMGDEGKVAFSSSQTEFIQDTGASRSRILGLRP
jgi:hypothetical protein